VAAQSFFFPRPSPALISTLSLHDALPICLRWGTSNRGSSGALPCGRSSSSAVPRPVGRVVEESAKRPPRVPSTLVMLKLEPSSRSEEHTSELQSLRHLVCRLLLEKKKNKE